MIKILYSLQKMIQGTPSWAALILFILLPIDIAFADNIFSIQYPQDDFSLSYINMLLGPLSEIGPYLKTNTFSFLVVKLLSLSIAVASFMAAYLVYKATMNSSQEGVFLGQQWSSMTVILRGVVGYGLLTPDLYGYALIQKFFMSVILAGIGLANHLWDIIIVNYEKGNSMLNDSAYTADDQTMANHLIRVALSLNYLVDNQYIQSSYLLSLNYDETKVQLEVTYLNGASGGRAEQQPEPWIIFQLNSSKYTKISPEMLENLTYLLNIYYSDSIVQALSTGIAQSKNDASTTIAALTQQTLQPADLKAWVENLYQSAHAVMTVTLPSRENEMSGYQKEGWLTAGSIYWKLSQNTASESYSAALAIPSTSTTDQQKFFSKLSTTNLSTTSDPNVIGLIDNVTGQLPAQLSSEIGDIPVDSQYQGSLASINFSFGSLKGVYEKVMNGEDPLRDFIADCQNLLKSIIVFVTASLVSMIAVSFYSVLRCQYPTFHMISYFLGSALILIVSFSFILLPPAILGGYYLPLIPLIIYTAAGFTWLFKVIEAIVAAPIVAVALIEPTNDDFGKSEASTILLLMVALKPALMVVGFAIAMRINIIGFVIYSYALSGFLNFEDFIFTSSTVFIEKFIAYIILDQMSVYMIIAIVNRGFGLIHQLPDQVFGWIGGKGDESDVNSIVDEAKSGAEQGIKMMSQIFDICSGVAKVGMQASKTFSDDKYK
ncbi:hypothetical protein EBR43_00805 [bacterium]|nr:hypothetical protein [bacterium]NBW56328.1 hypothetical protein [bacterium]NBX71989.1 hypothetical protein [bacterium]